jgi:hypothetical protein
MTAEGTVQGIDDLAGIKNFWQKKEVQKKELLPTRASLLERLKTVSEEESWSANTIPRKVLSKAG